ncbi:ethanolamine ammonia-lyase subunit EutC [Leptospira brenneri]|uniref:Ethanolamine ammonia-lyase small subunit n=1 Tax=Leptospira brenneri TaxID=2023182 RepID=A0A2M9Y028_9LEPT|nr:ethanolamine ammonia-lyase subunit EutC [Leptospira brenneri]PJZ44920.1 ethanolamine ammonia-lyase [Leptospira brenneri]TGK95281.1 ethanolamine ammonia-lyase subunit EutC [Leptospira brenneri]
MTFLDEWKEFSNARIGLPRSGGSISTKEVLRFRLDHARARDAVNLSPDFLKLTQSLDMMGKSKNLSSLLVKSQVDTKEEYLLRPDLGRRLDFESTCKLQPLAGDFDLVLIAVDGLSAKAIDENLIPFFELLTDSIEKKQMSMAPIILSKFGRVAIGDEIGEILNAKVSVVVIGERPGLSSADSLGVYITYHPQVGKTDESRNCISNVRPSGFSFESAVQKTIYLIQESMQRKLSGVELKDEMPPEFLPKPKDSLRIEDKN